DRTPLGLQNITDKHRESPDRLTDTGWVERPTPACEMGQDGFRHPHRAIFDDTEQTKSRLSLVNADGSVEDSDDAAGTARRNGPPAVRHGPLHGMTYASRSRHDSRIQPT